MLSAINNHETCLAVFIDLKKAFDTVNHQILIAKLENLGIKGDLLLWISNYLHDSQQKTIANNTILESLHVECGVPQGSILGPLFFITYINDVTTFLGNNFGLYAEDTVIFAHNSDKHIAERELQNKLDLFVEWSEYNVLSINARKTKLMVLGY